MPIDYKKYPSNWLSEIRPRILKRANNQCENEGCEFIHLEYVWRVKDKNKTIGWYKNEGEAFEKSKILNTKNDPVKIRVVLTIAHLDHDEMNLNVKDERLMALCQLCHLRYDSEEKKRRQKLK